MIVQVPGILEVGDFGEDEVWIYISGDDLKAYVKTLEIICEPPSSLNPEFDDLVNWMKAGAIGKIVALTGVYGKIVSAIINLDFMFQLSEKSAARRLLNELKGKSSAVCVIWSTAAFSTVHRVMTTTEEDVKKMAKKYPHLVKSTN